MSETATEKQEICKIPALMWLFSLKIQKRYILNILIIQKITKYKSLFRDVFKKGPAKHEL